MKEIGIGLLFLIGFIGFIWVMTINDLGLKKVFAPKFEDVRRETFEHSKAYNQGMIQELQNMQFEYVKATPEQKKGLASLIRHRAADYPMDKMPADLRNFIRDLP